MILPSLVDALATPAKLSYIGLSEACLFPAPLGEHLDVYEDPLASTVFAHIRSSIDHARQLFTFGLIPQTFPWSWCRLLSPFGSERQNCLDDARSIWSLLTTLEESANPLHKGFAKSLWMKNWTCFREPMQMLQSSGYVASSKLEEYVREMTNHISSSLSLEVGLFCASCLNFFAFLVLLFC